MEGTHDEAHLKWVKIEVVTDFLFGHAEAVAAYVGECRRSTEPQKHLVTRECRGGGRAFGMAWGGVHSMPARGRGLFFDPVDVCFCAQEEGFAGDGGARHEASGEGVHGELFKFASGGDGGGLAFLTKKVNTAIGV